MLTKEERIASRARCEKDNPNGYDFGRMYRHDLPAALDDLDAKDAEIDRLQARVEANEQAEDDKIVLYKGLIADRDRLQARCEALEAELSELRAESQHWESDCNTCPLSDFELCHEICHTKERLLSFAANAALTAEALERANKRYAPCETCMHLEDVETSYCGNCEWWRTSLVEGAKDLWKFDEARFRKEQSDE